MVNPGFWSNPGLVPLAAYFIDPDACTTLIT